MGKNISTILAVFLLACFLASLTQHFIFCIKIDGELEKLNLEKSRIYRTSHRDIRLELFLRDEYGLEGLILPCR